MRLFPGYEVRGCDIRKKTVGSLEKPCLYSITAGQRNQKSLIFHLKIEDSFHQCHIHIVNATSCNFSCVEPTCPGIHKMSVDPTFVSCIPNFHKMKNGRTRHKYFIDFDNLEIRKITNWTVIEHKTLPHGKQRAGKPIVKDCKQDFYSQVRKDFREMHTARSLETWELEIVSDFAKI